MMPITNALDNAKRLESLGFTHEQAQGLSEMLEATAHAAQPDLSHLATKADLQVLRTEVQAMENRILGELRTQMLWFFTMLVGLLGVTIAIIKLFP